MPMDKLRIGVIGLGNMGSHHATYMDSLESAVLSAVCDANPAAADRVAQKFPGVARFTRFEDLLESGACDAILIATPHYQHPLITDAAFAKNLHVLCEKPVAVRVGDARKTNDLHKKHPHLIYALMFQARTTPIYQKIKQLIDNGELGEISRITWIATNWFRTWTYYALGGWRGTWAGEGGGVLINQNPHNLDLLQWLPSMMPSRITAIASLGKYHPIEVEDELSAILEYPGGAIAHFITGTGEYPGTDRLEIAGDRGRLVCERNTLTLHQTRKPVRQTRETSKEAFAHIETWEIDIPISTSAKADPHQAVTQNFVNAILKNEPLIAPGEEGVKGLEIGNAMLMAGVTRESVTLPLDAQTYEALLKDLEKKHGGKKKLAAPADAVVDMNASFSKA